MRLVGCKGVCVLSATAIHRYVLEAHRDRTWLCYVIPLHVPIRIAISGILFVVDSGSGVIVHVIGVVDDAMIKFAASVNVPIETVAS